MKLTKENILRIEKLLDMEGMTVDIFIDQERELDSGGGVMVKRGKMLVINGVPPKAEDIKFPAVLVSDSDTNVEIIARNPGDEPIAMGSVLVPGGVTLTGFTTRKAPDAE